MPTSEHYKRSAEECRRLAEQAPDEIKRGRGDTVPLPFELPATSEDDETAN
jgi:hypothetical protein